jgi:hypothetical protein
MATSAPTIQRNASRVNEETRECQPHYDITLFHDTAVAASEDGGWLDVGVGANLVLTLTMSAETGTAVYDVTIQTSPNSDGTSVRTLGTAFTQISANGSERKSFACSDRYVRASVAYSSTGNATVDVSGISVRGGS